MISFIPNTHFSLPHVPNRTPFIIKSQHEWRYWAEEKTVKGNVYVYRSPTPGTGKIRHVTLVEVKYELYYLDIGDDVYQNLVTDCVYVAGVNKSVLDVIASNTFYAVTDDRSVEVFFSGDKPNRSGDRHNGARHQLIDCNNLLSNYAEKELKVYDPNDAFPLVYVPPGTVVVRP